MSRARRVQALLVFALLVAIFAVTAGGGEERSRPEKESERVTLKVSGMT